MSSWSHSSSQATYRLRRVFSFHCKTHRALILLLLASKPDPLSLGSGLGPPLRGAFVCPWKISILTVPSTSEQSPLCSDVFLCLRQKRRHPPAPLLLLSKSQPLTLGCDLGPPLRGGFFLSQGNIDFNRPFQKSRMWKCSGFLLISSSRFLLPYLLPVHGIFGRKR